LERPVVEREIEPEDEEVRPLPLNSRMRRAFEDVEPFVERLREDEPATPPRTAGWDLIRPPWEFPPEG
jgi:hypothetical protein